MKPRQDTAHWLQSIGAEATPHARTLSGTGQQDLLQLGRTTPCTSPDRKQHNGSQRGDKKALVTPLVTEFDRHNRPTEPRAMPITKQKILGASAGWVAVTLNVLPGLGAGYLYQRRWKAYWITSALATTWFVLGAVLGQGAEAAEEMQNQLVGLGGLVALAAGTAVEAGLAVKKARSAD